LAPPVAAISDSPPSHSQITNLLHTERFQSILVTEFHHLDPSDYEDDYEDDDEDPTTTVPFGGGARGGHPQSDDPVTLHGKEGSMNQSLYGDDPYGYYDGEEDEEGDDEVESFDPPWPPAHEPFCALPHIQEHVLLEIAAGRNSRGKAVRPMELPKGPTMRVVLPGSLRERGEFCLVDVAFMKNTTPSGGASSATASASKQEDYRWRVRRTRFQTISDYV